MGTIFSKTSHLHAQVPKYVLLMQFLIYLSGLPMLVGLLFRLLVCVCVTMTNSCLGASSAYFGHYLKATWHLCFETG